MSKCGRRDGSYPVTATREACRSHVILTHRAFARSRDRGFPRLRTLRVFRDQNVPVPAFRGCMVPGSIVAQFGLALHSPFVSSCQTLSPKCISPSSALPSISYPIRHQPQTHILFIPPIPRTPISPPGGASRLLLLVDSSASQQPSSRTVLPPDRINEHPLAGSRSAEPSKSNHGSESRSLRPSNPGAVPYFLQSQAVGLRPERHAEREKRRDGESAHGTLAQLRL